MSQYKLRRNTNTDLRVNINYVGIPTQNWVPINYVEHQHRTTSQYKLRRNTNTELRVTVN